MNFSFAFFFFFQAEDGIRDSSVTGVQTCALPISSQGALIVRAWRTRGVIDDDFGAGRADRLLNLAGDGDLPGRQVSVVRRTLAPASNAALASRAICSGVTGTWCCFGSVSTPFSAQVMTALSLMRCIPNAPCAAVCIMAVGSVRLLALTGYGAAASRTQHGGR